MGRAGCILVEGDEDVPKNARAALKWFGKAAKQGMAHAQFNLGKLFCDGDEGVPKDVPLAVKWFTKAAEQELAEAQCNLGSLLYRGGEGVPKDARGCKMAHQGGRTRKRRSAVQPRDSATSRRRRRAHRRARGAPLVHPIGESGRGDCTVQS